MWSGGLFSFLPRLPASLLHFLPSFFSFSLSPVGTLKTNNTIIHCLYHPTNEGCFNTPNRKREIISRKELVLIHKNLPEAVASRGEALGR